MGMNLKGDGNLDRKITIQSGQGISQAIAGELGLNEAQCQKLGKSIWTQIIEIAEADDSFENDSKKYKKDMMLHKGNEFKFTTEAFKKIIKLVNEKLKKQIKLPTEEQNIQQKSGDSATGTAEQAELGASEVQVVEKKSTYVNPEEACFEKPRKEVEGKTARYDKATKEAKTLQTAFQKAIDNNDVMDFTSGKNWEAFGNKDIEDWEENGNIDAICFMLAEDDELAKQLAKELSESRIKKYMTHMGVTNTDYNADNLIKASKDFKASFNEDMDIEANYINNDKGYWLKTNVDNLSQKLEIKSDSIINEAKRTVTMAQKRAESLKASIKKATEEESLEDFARNYNDLNCDLADYTLEAKSFMLADNDNHDIAKALLGDMLATQRVLLMKKLCEKNETEFDERKTDFTKDEIINEATKYKNKLEANAAEETKRNNDAAEAYNKAARIFSEMFNSDGIKKECVTDQKTGEKYYILTNPKNNETIKVTYLKNSSSIYEITIGDIKIDFPYKEQFKITYNNYCYHVNQPLPFRSKLEFSLKTTQ